VLRATSNKIRDTIAMIARLHAASLAPHGTLPMAAGADLTPFLTQQRYSIGILVSNLRWTSPTFRYALRVAMAISVGLDCQRMAALQDARLLDRADHRRDPQAELQHHPPAPRRPPGRHPDRLPADRRDPAFRARARSAVRLPVRRHRGGPDLPVRQIPLHGIAASMQALLLIGLTVPHGASAIGERLLDTLLGTLIATFFSYVLPSWEYQDLPRLVDEVLDANRKYVDAAAALLLGRAGDDFRYRVSRKQFMDSLATLSAALGRMLDEPAAKQRAPAELNRFTVQNYLLVAHMAALRLLLQRYAENMPRAEVEAALGRAFAAVRTSLGSAPPTAGAAPAQPMGRRGWPGWAPLQRRLRHAAQVLQQDAAQVARSYFFGSAAIGDFWASA
jgi:uncharacterized membrane protein YccC